MNPPHQHNEKGTKKLSKESKTFHNKKTMSKAINNGVLLIHIKWFSTENLDTKRYFPGLPCRVCITQHIVNFLVEQVFRLKVSSIFSAKNIN